MSEWQPIETAPKGEQKKYGSGPRILIMHRWVDIGYWRFHRNPNAGSWKDGQYRNCTPTHWMPLPDPPRSET